MPKYTENLNLFEYDVEKDGKNTYNISQCLNDNWDKIDSALGNVANLTTEQKANFVSAINEIVSNLDKKSSIDLNNLSALGQSILDRKVEVEALLQQNGYAKFSWKEDNKISNFLIQFGTLTWTNKAQVTITLPCSFNGHYATIAGDVGSGKVCFATGSHTLTNFILHSPLSSNILGAYWFAIGT